MNLFALVLSLMLSMSLHADDITSKYKKLYSSSERLSNEDLNLLSKRDIILVPGILSEVLSWEDDRGTVDFSILTTGYFGAQFKHLKNNLNLPAQKLLSSSKSVLETRALIAEAINKSRSRNRKAIIIAHSLGGLALMDHLLEADEGEWNSIAGIIFLQTPFYGSPIASVFLENPYHADKWLKPFLPFLNTNIETIKYLSVEYRSNFVQNNFFRMHEILTKIPSITVAGVVNGHNTLFLPAVHVMKFGCLLNAKGFCITQKLWEGRYEESDGMVPMSSAKFAQTDYVKLEGVDHGESVVKLPFNDISKEVMTESLLKLLIEKREE